MKELIDQLEKQFTSLRKAGEALGIDHQKLSFWRSKAVKQREFLEEFEKIRKALRIPKDKFWDKIRGK